MAKAIRGVTTHGDESSETITGTEGADNLHGYGGEDQLVGLGGADNLYGGAGNDRLEGGTGNDTLQGHEGSDTLLGGDGDDILHGQDGSDIVDGGAGNDLISWALGDDVLTGGSGADRFFGGAIYWTDQQAGTVLITDFESGVDVLDITRYDADERTAPGIIKGKSTPGNEAFTVVNSTDGVTPGHLVITTGVDEFGRPITIVLKYTNTDAGADIVVHLLGTTADNEPLIGAQDIWL